VSAGVSAGGSAGLKGTSGLERQRPPEVRATVLRELHAAPTDVLQSRSAEPFLGDGLHLTRAVHIPELARSVLGHTPTHTSACTTLETLYVEAKGAPQPRGPRVQFIGERGAWRGALHEFSAPFSVPRVAPLSSRLPACLCTCARMPTSRVPREHAVGVAYVYAMRMGGGWMEAYLDCLVGPPSRSKPSVSQPCFARSHCQS
jgi:hypothetical protein